MSHEIENMAHVGIMPWHGISTELPQDISTQEMLKAANLDWEVNKVPAFYEVNGTRYPLGKDALVRSSDGKCLDTVGPDWNPVQNQEAFDFFKELVERGDMTMETAGSLRGGQITWALAKVNESFELFDGDKTDAYLLFTNPHKFGQTTSIQFNPIRVVCANTLAMAFSQKVQNIVRVSHRKQFNADNVKEMLGITKNKLYKYKETAEFLGARKAKKEDIISYAETVFPVITQKKEARKELSKNAKKVIDALDTQPGAEYAAGSWWSVWNSLTYTIDHNIGRSQDTRLTSAWYGVNRQRKIEALKLAVDFAEKSPALLVA